MGSRIIKPKADVHNTWRLSTSATISTMSMGEQRRIYELQKREEMARKPRVRDVKSGVYLKLCMIECGICGHKTGYDVAWRDSAGVPCCGRCGEQLWSPTVWKAANVVRRLHGDFAEFAHMLQTGLEGDGDGDGDG